MVSRLSDIPMRTSPMIPGLNYISMGRMRPAGETLGIAHLVPMVKIRMPLVKKAVVADPVFNNDDIGLNINRILRSVVTWATVMMVGIWFRNDTA